MKLKIQTKRQCEICKQLTLGFTLGGSAVAGAIGIFLGPILGKE